MALTDENGGMNTTMLVSPANAFGGQPYPVFMGGGQQSGNGFGDGNSGWWLILLFLLVIAGGNGWGNNAGGGGGGFGGNRGGQSYRGSYARGRGTNARRDSMGRYSRETRYSRDGYSRGGADEMVSELRELMQDAPDERTKQEFKKFIEKVENM